MAVEKDTTLITTVEVPGAYGRIEGISGVKDGQTQVMFSWWASQTAAGDRVPTIKCEKFTLSPDRLAANPALQAAHDEYVRQYYLELKTDELSDTTDVQ